MKNRARKNLSQDESSDIILSIPQTYKETCKNDEISIIIHKFNNAQTVNEQITLIHSFSAFLNIPSDDNSPLALQILTHLFVTTSPKHPVKKSILRTFANANNFVSEISKELSEQLLNLIENVDEYNDRVNSINDCFNNCPAGIKAVSLILEKVFSLLIESLKYYLAEISGATSPIELQELLKYIHNSTRAIVAVSQQCDNINSIIKNYTEDILKICVTILNNPDIVYDTKNNCGIILTIATNTDIKNGYSLLLNTCIDENACIPKWNIEFNDFKDDIVVTCIFGGILNCAKPEQLCKYDDSFELSHIYKIADKLLEISKNCADKPSTILGVNRTLLLVSRALGPLKEEDLIKIISSLLDHVWTQLDHNLDTIRHVSKSIFINLVKLSKQQDISLEQLLKSHLVNIVIENVLNTPVFRNGRYVALSIIGKEVGCDVILLKHPNLIQELLNYAQESSISSYVTSCYESLMRCQLKETDDETWIKNWVLPLISELAKNGELDEKGSCFQKLLTNAILIRPSIIKSCLSRWSIDNDLQFSSLLKCTLIARKLGAHFKDANKWRGMLDYNILDLAMSHQNDEIRISSLAVIAESHKTTEIFNEYELKFVVDFLRYNINTQLPATRQRILFLMKKILTRFSDSFYSITRRFSKIYEHITKLETDSQYEILQHQIFNYENFILKLRDCIFDSLFPGANFSRRIICLEVLTLLDPILEELKIPDEKLWKQFEVDSLLLCLSDSYESNKQLSAILLKKCPQDLLKLHTVEHTKEFINDALKLASSVRPADTVTAAYMLETTMYSVVINEVLVQILQTEQNYPEEYLILSLLLKQLKEQIEIGHNSLLKAAGSAPMHGTLFCIRHLMEKYLFNSNLTESHWKTLMGDIIETCFKVSEIVCPVVNSSSPEGHLPMDHETVDSDEEVVTAQMLLVCSWRSIKEVSLLLGEITLRSKIVGENQNGFITEEQMLKIGEHFTVLLTETKHRGAFEQAYVGFSKLCNRLWRCKAETLHQLPITWLNDIISAISGQNSAQNNKLCATRRSAGVPFMIQAIVASELQTGGSSHFHQSMKSLLQFANHSEDNIEMRTHAMNILRALYRHTQLGEDISPYVAEGVIASITGFSRKTWAERNSATLLFSSLMTRIFGVQRTKDTEHLNIRNKMTAKVFFLRYSSLYPFLLAKLQELTDEYCETYKEVALYPILLLLARLYPANSEESDSNNQLQNFIPYVRICAKNKSLKTRELAAKALVPLVQTQHRENLFKELFALLKHSMEKNYIHGILLQIFYLLPTLTANNFDSLINTEIKNSLWLIKCNSTNCCTIISALYMQIVSKIFMRKSECTISQEIFSLILKQNKYIKDNCITGKTIYYREAINLQLTLLLQELNSTKICSFLFEQLYQHQNKDVQEFILNFLMCLLRNSNTAVHIDNLELPEEEKLLMNVISEEFKKEIINKIKQQIKTFTAMLKYKPEYNDILLSKIIFVLFNLQEDTMSFIKEINVFDLFQTYSEDQEIMSSLMSIMPSVLKVVSQNMEENNLSVNLTTMLKIIFEATSSRYNFVCRYYSALTLLEIKPLIFKEIKIDIENYLLLWKTIMILLADSEPVVRNTISKLLPNHPVAEKAREELLIKSVELIKATSIEKCISLLLFWSLIVFNSEDDDEDIELQIFDRGEVSTYVEDMCLSKLSANFLATLIKCNDISDISKVFIQIITILKNDDNLWDGYKTDRDILIKVLAEVQETTNSTTNNLKKYLDSKENTWSNLDVYYKYKIVNVLKAVLPHNVLDE